MNDKIYKTDQNPKIVSLKNIVINHIYKAIVEKKYKPKQHIKETVLSDSLSISRAPVREALLQLVGMGILTKVDRVGIFLNDITPAQILDTYHTKGLIEGYLSNDFTRYCDKNDIEALEHIIYEMKQDISNGGENQIDIGTKFHKTILKYSYNKVLLNTLKQVNIKSKILFSQNWSKLYSTKDIIDRHQKIVDIIKTKQSKAVERVIREHYINTGKKIAIIKGKKS